MNWYEAIAALENQSRPQAETLPEFDKIVPRTVKEEPKEISIESQDLFEDFPTTPNPRKNALN